MAPPGAARLHRAGPPRAIRLVAALSTLVVVVGAALPLDAQALGWMGRGADSDSTGAYVVASRVAVPVAPGPMVADQRRALLHVLDHDAESGTGSLRAYDIDSLAPLGEPVPAESRAELGYDPVTSTVLAPVGSTLVMHRWDGTGGYATSSVEVGDEARAVHYDGEDGRDRIVVATAGGLTILNREGGTWSAHAYPGAPLGPSPRLAVTPDGDIVAVDATGARGPLLVHIDPTADEASWGPFGEGATAATAEGPPATRSLGHPVLAFRVGPEILLVDEAGGRQSLAPEDGAWRPVGDARPGTGGPVAAGALDPVDGTLYLADRGTGDISVVRGDDTSVLSLAANGGLSAGPASTLFVAASDPETGGHTIVVVGPAPVPPVEPPEPDPEPDDDRDGGRDPEPGGDDVPGDDDLGDDREPEPVRPPQPSWRPPAAWPGPPQPRPVAPARPPMPGVPARPAERGQLHEGVGSRQGADLDVVRSTPSAPVEDAGPGELRWTIGGPGAPVVLSAAELRGDHWAFSGATEPVSVHDTRPGNLPWTLTGQVSDFAGGLPARYLGWTPRLVVPGGGAHPGAPVASGLMGGHGLAQAATLASAPAGHEEGEATLVADLELRVPVGTAGGTYRTTLTITAIG